jgi:hypothetical protein
MAPTLCDLPEDVLRSKVLAHIEDLPDLVSLSTTCKSFRTLVLELKLWRGARPSCETLIWGSTAAIVGPRNKLRMLKQ